MRAGDIVIATAGKDKGKYFVIIGERDGKLLIANGRRRKVQRPKAKAEKHLRLVCSGADQPICTNKVILKLLKPYTMAYFKEES